MPRRASYRSPRWQLTGQENLMSPNTLSQREWEVARLASIGVSNKGIASVLNVAEGTVKVHLHRIMQKLGVKNRTVLAAIILGPAARPATHEGDPPEPGRVSGLTRSRRTSGVM